jgi:hypothetical protein
MALSLVLIGRNGTVTCTERKFRNAIHSLHRLMPDFINLGRPLLTLQQHYLLGSYGSALSVLPLAIMVDIRTISLVYLCSTVRLFPSCIF